MYSRGWVDRNSVLEDVFVHLNEEVLKSCFAFIDSFKEEVSCSCLMYTLESQESTTHAHTLFDLKVPMAVPHGRSCHCVTVKRFSKSFCVHRCLTNGFGFMDLK